MSNIQVVLGEVGVGAWTGSCSNRLLVEDVWTELDLEDKKNSRYSGRSQEVVMRKRVRKHATGRRTWWRIENLIIDNSTGAAR